METKPLLSICIPTYNRAEYLEKNIKSIISQQEFLNGSVEIVVSDNESTDNTENICLNYSQKFQNFKYFKHDNSVAAESNFSSVLSKGTGIFRKLCNDSLCFTENSLQFLCKLIEENKNEKPFMFFLNNSRDKPYSTTNTLDDFLKQTSFFVTWIGGLGLWEDECYNIFEYSETIKTHLWQTAVVLDKVSRKNKALVVFESFVTNQIVRDKDISYGLYQVFYINYLNLIKPYKISNETFDWLEKELFFSFFIHWILEYEFNKKCYIFSKTENLKKSVFLCCKTKPYFSDFKQCYKDRKRCIRNEKHKVIKEFIKRPLRKIKKIIIRNRPC